MGKKKSGIVKSSTLKKYLKTLIRYHRIKKCQGCICLQGGLSGLKYEAQKLGDKKLEKEIDHYIVRDTHKCLGCDPCPPAKITMKFC